jgi:hypothetical protein
LAAGRRSYSIPLTLTALLNDNGNVEVLYPVQVRVDGSNIAARMSEIKEWLDRHVEPVTSQYRMDADGVLCRVDFKLPSEAAAFAEAFSGFVVG